MKAREGVYRRASSAALPAIVVIVVVLALCLGLAFTIDDTLFLDQARHVLVEPVHPTAFDGVYSFAPERMSQIMASGPAMAHVLVPSVALGGAEWAAHLAQLAAFVLALVATAALGLRSGLSEDAARAVSLRLAATPAALGMAGTKMPDVPAMAFGVFGVERALAFTQKARTHQAVAAACPLIVALVLVATSDPQSASAVGVAILRADSVLAGLGRRAATEWKATAAASRKTVWFDGHWGFQWYAEKAGGRAWSSAPPCAETGDLVVSSELTGLGFLQSIPNRWLIRTVTDSRPEGRAMSRSGAGFSSNSFCDLPWAWGTEPVERYDVWEIE